ncbi:hypothetical protein [Chitinophaga solisilvae]|uniref:hypothetical protein n=1 Tax=Chitinophaga solisilvae TaxID=1233460 RepID=UPI001F171AE6|nr:hypothetical protein [Chitinophaga solisilvae]
MQCILTLYAQPLLSPLGRDAGNYSYHFHDVYSANMHPAALPLLPGLSAGIYSERRFMLKDISLYMAMLGIPAGMGAFGLMVARFGNPLYYRQQVSGAYGHRIGHNVSTGLQFSYMSQAVQGYGTASALSVTGGTLGRLWQHVYAGLLIRYTQLLPLLYSGGVGIEASKDCLFSAGFETGGGTVTTGSVNMQYRIASRLGLRLGITTMPGYCHAGFALQLHTLHIAVGTGFHPQLGFTPSTTIIWQQQEK